MRNPTNIVEGALTRFKQAGLDHDQAVHLILRAGDIILGCDSSWPGSGGSGHLEIPRNPEFMKAAAMGLAAAASTSSGTDLVSEIFSPDDPDGEKPGGQISGKETPAPKPRPDPAASLMIAAGCKTAERAFFTGSEALGFPLAAPRGVNPRESIALAAGLGATLGVGTSIASRIMNRNNPEYEKKSLISSALKWGLTGGAISTGTNIYNASIPGAR